MTIESFEQELQNIDTNFKIVRNQKAKGMATVFLYGEPLFGVPADGIYDEVKPGYGVELPNGNFYRHRTRPEALETARGMWQRLKSDPDYADALLGRGAYSDANLK